MEAKLLINMLISTLSRRPVASGRPGGLVIKELDRSFQIPHLAELWGVKKALKTRSCSRGPAKFTPQIQEQPPLAFAVTGFGSFLKGMLVPIPSGTGKCILQLLCPVLTSGAFNRWVEHRE